MQRLGTPHPGDLRRTEACVCRRHRDCRGHVCGHSHQALDPTHDHYIYAVPTVDGQQCVSVYCPFLGHCLPRGDSGGGRPQVGVGATAELPVNTPSDCSHCSYINQLFPNVGPPWYRLGSGRGIPSDWAPPGQWGPEPNLQQTAANHDAASTTNHANDNDGYFPDGDPALEFTLQDIQANYYGQLPDLKYLFDEDNSSKSKSDGVVHNKYDDVSDAGATDGDSQSGEEGEAAGGAQAGDEEAGAAATGAGDEDAGGGRSRGLGAVEETARDGFEAKEPVWRGDVDDYLAPDLKEESLTIPFEDY